jgi:hypothetical protein
MSLFFVSINKLELAKLQSYGAKPISEHRDKRAFSSTFTCLNEDRDGYLRIICGCGIELLKLGILPLAEINKTMTMVLSCTLQVAALRKRTREPDSRHRNC